MQVKSLGEMLSLLGEQMDQLRPKNKPSRETVAAARASATVVNSYNSTVRLGMEYARVKGQEPDLGFLKLGFNPTAKAMEAKAK